jgi:hypothetical protein
LACTDDARTARDLTGTIHISANFFPDKFIQRRMTMIKHLVMAAVALTGVSVIQPASAQDVGVGVGVGPAGAGVTIGTGRGDRYRDREVIREREYRNRDRDETVVIKRKRDYDPDRRVIIERDRY